MKKVIFTGNDCIHFKSLKENDIKIIGYVSENQKNLVLKNQDLYNLDKNLKISKYTTYFSEIDFIDRNKKLNIFIFDNLVEAAMWLEDMI